MKKSIKVAALTLLATGLLAGCSSGGSDQPKVQEISAAQSEAPVGTEIRIVTNVESGATWTLEDNTCGADFVGESEGVVYVTVSAVKAGSVTVKASAKGYTSPTVSLTFTETQQTISVEPSSSVFVGQSIALTSNASAAGWSLSDNTCGATLSAEIGSSVSVSAQSAGSVVVSASALGYTNASVTLTFTVPAWTDEEEGIMRDLLHGEVLPYVNGLSEFPECYASGKYAVVEGGTASPEVLAAYAALFTEEAGWIAQPTSEDEPKPGEPILEYAFEKSVTTEAGTRYVYVYFATLDASYNPVANGSFMLNASDPYIYEFPTDEFEWAKDELGIESDIVIPEVEASHYYYDESDYFVLCFFESEEADGGYTALLDEADYNKYGYQSLFKVYVADSKDGEFGLYYYYNESEGCLAIGLDLPFFMSEFPSEELLAYVGEEFASEAPVPAFEADRYYYEDGMVFCYTDNESAELYYSIALSEAGWYVYGATEFSDGSIAYLADSPDEKYGIQYMYDADVGILGIFVDECNYLHAFPSEEMNALAAELGSEVEIPSLQADYYMYNSTYSCALCFYFDGAEGDCGYGEVLKAAGWDVIGYDFALGQYIAKSPDEAFYLRYYVEENYLVIEVSEVVYLAEFPAEEFAYFTENVFYSETEVPAVEADYYSFNSDYARAGAYYASEEEDGGYGAILTEAGFTLSFYEEVEEDGSVTHFAFSPLSEYEERYVVYYSYFEGCLMIGVNYGIEMAYQTSAWDADAIAEVFYINNYDAFEVPAMSVASEEAVFVTTTYAISFLGMSFPYSADVYVMGATDEEIEAYLGELALDGWIFKEESTAASGSATKALEDIQKIATIEWGIIVDEEEGNFFYVSLVFTMEDIPAAEFPADQIVAYFPELELSEDMFGEYVGESEKLSFDAYDYYGMGFAIDVYNTTSEELGAYIASLGEDWVRVSDPVEGYPYDGIYQYKDTNLYLNAGDYLESWDCVSLLFYYQEPAVVVDEFPVAEANEFIAEYGLGFSLSAEATYAGEEFELDSGEDEDGYHYYSVTISGDVFSDYVDVLEPILLGAEYEKTTDEEGVAVYKESENLHQVNIYIDDNGDTVVEFWE